MLSAQTVRISQVNHVRKIRSQLNFLLSNPDNSKSYVQIDTPFQRDSSASHQTQNFDDLKIKKMQSILQDRQGLAFHSPQNREQNPKILQKIPLQSQFSKINAPLRYITDVSSSNLSNNNQNTYSDKSCFVQESQIILENNTYRIYQTKEVNNYLPQVLTSYQVTNFPTVRPLNENSSKADALESNQTNLNFSFTENQEQGQPTQIRLQSGYIQTAGNLQTNGQLNYTHKTLEEQVFITYDDIEGKANFNYVEQGIDQLISIKRNQNYKNKQKQE